jgi:hypothetical protein
LIIARFEHIQIKKGGNMRKMTIEEMEEADAKADVWMEEYRLGMWDIDTTEKEPDSGLESL